MQDISLEKAVSVLLEKVSQVREVEEVSLMEALGRTLAEDYVAPFDNPPLIDRHLTGTPSQQAILLRQQLHSRPSFRLSVRNVPVSILTSQCHRGRRCES